MTEKCCTKQPILVVKYDVGIKGEKKYLVCKNHIQKKPWNCYILSQKPIGDQIG